VRSDDVSLVQPYDGGGFGFQPVSGWAVRTPVLTGVTGFHQFFQLEDDEIFRVLAMDLVNVLGPGGTVVVPSIIDNLDQAFIATPLQLNVGFLGVGGFESFRNLAPIVGPGCQLRVDWVNGAVGTDFTVGVYGARAPLGTAFTI